jgi:hypothetical protein
MRSVMALGVVCLSFSVATVLISTTEALDERTSASIASDLRLAVATVIAIDGDDPDADERVSEALLSLDVDTFGALHALDEVDRMRARQLLVELRIHAQSMAAGGGLDDRLTQSHEELMDLLGVAASRSTVNAASAERMAQFATVVAFLALMVLGSVVLALRARAQHDASVASGLIEAGRRFGKLLDDSPNATAILAADGTLTYSSATLLALFVGRAPTTIDDLLRSVDVDQQAALRQHLLTPDANRLARNFSFGPPDRLRSFEVRVTDLRHDPLVMGHLLSANETTNQESVRRELERQARIDPLDRSAQPTGPRAVGLRGRSVRSDDVGSRWFQADQRSVGSRCR